MRAIHVTFKATFVVAVSLKLMFCANYACNKMSGQVWPIGYFSFAKNMDNALDIQGHLRFDVIWTPETYQKKTGQNLRYGMTGGT